MRTESKDKAADLLEWIASEARAIRNRGEDWSPMVVALRAGVVVGTLICRPFGEEETQAVEWEMALFPAALSADAAIWMVDGFRSSEGAVLDPDDEDFVRPLADPRASECLFAFYVAPDAQLVRMLPYGRNDDGSLRWEAPGFAEDTELAGPLLELFRAGFRPEEILPAAPAEVLEWLEAKGHAIDHK
jgi:hypothetical protein